MKKPVSLGREMVVLAGGILFLLTAAISGGPQPGHLVEFTLAAAGGDPAPRLFSLAPRSAEPGGLVVPGGSGYVEDQFAPFNTALGWQALANSTAAGECNTASGYQALYTNSSGMNNTASGYQALYHNTSGESNEAIGMGALYYNTTGAFNVGIGDISLEQNTSGFGNTGVGGGSLRGNSTGSYNTALGMGAGANTGTGNFNIHIGATQTGFINETNTIRIGIPYSPEHPTFAGQNRCFIAGVVDKSFKDGPIAQVVGIAGDGQLGTIPPELLPTKGDPGPQGPAGPAGEGLVPGSLLFMVSGAAPPLGYTLLGSTTYSMKRPDGKGSPITVYIYKKN